MTPKRTVTRAYIEGYIEGRLGTAHPKCPSLSSQAAQDYQDGMDRGRVVRHYQDETKSPNPTIQMAVDAIKKYKNEVR